MVLSISLSTHAANPLSEARVKEIISDAGDNTKIIAGSGITITGEGNSASPYSLSGCSGITVIGNGKTETPHVVSAITGGSSCSTTSGTCIIFQAMTGTLGDLVPESHRNPYDIDVSGKTGIAKADYICQTEGGLRKGSGTFKAWISDDSTDTKDHVLYATAKKYVGFSGITVGLSTTNSTDIGNLLSGKLTYYIDTGARMANWTGTNGEGTKDT